MSSEENFVSSEIGYLVTNATVYTWRQEKVTNKNAICLGEKGCVGPGESAQGVSLPGGVCPSACWDTHTPPPVDRMTDRCKNIALPQLSSGR